MKIISYCLLTLILIGVSLTMNTENSVASSSTTDSSNNLNSGIFESISKYKIKNKNKSKSKTKNASKEHKAEMKFKETNLAKSKEENTVSNASNNANKLTSTSKLTAKAAVTAQTNNKNASKGIEVGSSQKVSNKINVLSGPGAGSKAYRDTTLKAGPKLWEGWAKFYVYNTSSEKDLLKGPKKYNFYKNYDFYEQFKKDQNLNVNEKVGTEYKNVHDPYSFWVTLFPNNVNFSNSRIKAETTIYNTFTINRIAPVIEENGFKGGITLLPGQIGNFCFMIRVELGESSNYVLCLEEQSNMLQAAKIIKQLVINMQRNNGQILVSDKSKQPFNTDDLLERKSEKEKLITDQLVSTGSGTMGFGGTKVKTNSSIDGYWITLQSWSTCSLKCGGGTQSYHRMCVPPKNGGKPCQGEAILTKKCNEGPCPSIKKKDEPAHEDDKTGQPIVKVMPFSSRYQKYTKCIIKEQDALWLKQLPPKVGEEQKVKDVWMPVRLIMNNRTLTVLEGTDYDHQVHTFNLPYSRLFQSIDRPNCFGISEERPVRLDKQRKMIFCPFGVKTNGIEWVNEWDYDFNLFKFQCHTPKDFKDFNGTLSKGDEDKLNDKMNQMKADIIKQKEKKLQMQAEEEEVRNAEEKINSMELEAIKKEFNLEELIEKDEQAKEKAEEERIREEIAKEKEKHECLMRSIHEKEIENQYNLMKEQEMTDIEEQKKKAREDIVNKRKELNDKIHDMKRRASRRMRKLRQELKGSKISINDDVKNAYKKGGYDCIFRPGDNIYCKAKFITNPERFGDCMRSIHNKDDWCNVCCENEIGSMFPNERHRCLAKCSFMPSPGPNGVYDPKEKWFAAIKVGDGFVGHASQVAHDSVQNQSQLISKYVNELASEKVQQSSFHTEAHSESHSEFHSEQHSESHFAGSQSMSMGGGMTFTG